MSYRISDSNQLDLSSDARLLLRFSQHAGNRFRRQSGTSDSNAENTNAEGSVKADTATNFGTGDQALPDESSQPGRTSFFFSNLARSKVKCGTSEKIQ